MVLPAQVQEIWTAKQLSSSSEPDMYNHERGSVMTVFVFSAVVAEMIEVSIHPAAFV